MTPFDGKWGINLESGAVGEHATNRHAETDRETHSDRFFRVIQEEPIADDTEIEAG